CKGANEPLPQGFELVKPTEAEIAEVAEFPYRQLVGSLIYICRCAYPILSFAVSILSKFNSGWSIREVKAAKHCLRFTSTLIDKPFTVCPISSKNDPIQVDLISDASYMPKSIGTTTKSRTGWIVMLAGVPIQWRSKQQSRPAQSSSEAETYAACDGAKELSWVKQFIENVYGEFKPDVQLQLYDDSMATIKGINSGLLTDRNKHYFANMEFITDMVDSKELEVTFCPTDIMLADVLTKNVGKVKVQQFMMYMNNYIKWVQDVERLGRRKRKAVSI
ncbi:MAG: Ty1/Copia family ribonuclease HI, partial [Pseudomonadota bacterium]|nr:Ty1/Copia family ribonuclease HI [Pseudomonadota bacterium]